tara:strand:- start:233 stop:523 length:291 start_codon:yes stop_codon:yes gene_type:complete
MISFRDNPKFLTIRYEDLVSHPESIFMKICNFLRVEYDPQMILVDQVDSYYKDSTKFGVKKGIDKSRSEKWKSVISEGQNRLFDLFLGNEMKNLGY